MQKQHEMPRRFPESEMNEVQNHLQRFDSDIVDDYFVQFDHVDSEIDHL